MNFGIDFEEIGVDELIPRKKKRRLGAIYFYSDQDYLRESSSLVHLNTLQKDLLEKCIESADHLIPEAINDKINEEPTSTFLSPQTSESVPPVPAPHPPASYNALRRSRRKATSTCSCSQSHQTTNNKILKKSKENPYKKPCLKCFLNSSKKYYEQDHKIIQRTLNLLAPNSQFEVDNEEELTQDLEIAFKVLLKQKGLTNLTDISSEILINYELESTPNIPNPLSELINPKFTPDSLKFNSKLAHSQSSTIFDTPITSPASDWSSEKLDEILERETNIPPTKYNCLHEHNYFFKKSYDIPGSEYSFLDTPVDSPIAPETDKKIKSLSNLNKISIDDSLDSHGPGSNSISVWQEHNYFQTAFKPKKFEPLNNELTPPSSEIDNAEMENEISESFCDTKKFVLNPWEILTTLPELKREKLQDHFEEEMKSLNRRRPGRPLKIGSKRELKSQQPNNKENSSSTKIYNKLKRMFEFSFPKGINFSNIQKIKKSDEPQKSNKTAIKVNKSPSKKSKVLKLSKNHPTNKAKNDVKKCLNIPEELSESDPDDLYNDILAGVKEYEDENWCDLSDSSFSNSESEHSDNDNSDHEKISDTEISNIFQSTIFRDLLLSDLDDGNSSSDSDENEIVDLGKEPKSRNDLFDLETSSSDTDEKESIKEPKSKTILLSDLEMSSSDTDERESIQKPKSKNVLLSDLEMSSDTDENEDLIKESNDITFERIQNIFKETIWDIKPISDLDSNSDDSLELMPPPKKKIRKSKKIKPEPRQLEMPSRLEFMLKSSDTLVKASLSSSTKDATILSNSLPVLPDNNSTTQVFPTPEQKVYKREQEINNTNQPAYKIENFMKPSKAHVKNDTEDELFIEFEPQPDPVDPQEEIPNVACELDVRTSEINEEIMKRDPRTADSLLHKYFCREGNCEFYNLNVRKNKFHWTKSILEACSSTLVHSNPTHGKNDLIVKMSIFESNSAGEYEEHLKNYNYKHKFWNKPTAQIEVLSSTKLHELRPYFHCVKDCICTSEVRQYVTNMNGNGLFLPDLACNRNPEWLFEIEENVLLDKSNLQSVELAERLLNYYNKNPKLNIGPKEILDSKNMTLGCLSLRYGFPYLYIHQGGCRHYIVIHEARLPTPGEVTQHSTFPRYLEHSPPRRRILCSANCRNMAQWAVKNCDFLIEDPAFLCTNCAQLLLCHQKENGKFKLINEPVEVYRMLQPANLQRYIVETVPKPIKLKYSTVDCAQPQLSTEDYIGPSPLNTENHPIIKKVGNSETLSSEFVEAQIKCSITANLKALILPKAPLKKKGKRLPLENRFTYPPRSQRIRIPTRKANL